MVWPFWNRSGGSVAQGIVAVLDPANAESVKTTSNRGDATFVGVFRQNTLSGSTGLVTLGGYTPVINVDGQAAIGNYLITSNQAGKANPVSAGSTPGIFGVALSSGSPSVSGIIFPGKAVY
jgi:hypothetical protein